MTDHATAPLLTRAGGPLSREAAEATSAALGEPLWVRQQRLAAWEAFERLPFPAQLRPEEWRRTDISGLDLGALIVPPRRVAAAPPWELLGVTGGAGERAGLVTHVDGQTVARGLGEAAARGGVIFTDLASAAVQHPDLVREHLFSTVANYDDHKFRALHAALWSAGTLLYVPKGVEVTLPLVAQSWLGVPGAALFPHTLLIADQGSQVTLIDIAASAPTDGRTFACGVTELILRQGAQVRYLAFREWGPSTWEVGSLIRAHLERDATLHSLMVALGGALVKVDVESLLAGQGASSEMLGVYFGADRQHIDFHTLQEHRAPHTHSDLLYRGAVKDTARAVFAGLIRVAWGAQKTNAFQANRNLILSEGARSDSIPKLEIMANDLRCTHGSATSRLNEEHIFYLMSRGLTRAQATRMIAEGFFSDVLDRIPQERVRAFLQTRIAEKMGDR
ncbi:MAG: Fe-S cluster assembly protein SufD [Armatimonadetes bacterium]|nr:Fe-S cluster assembly protein SufD [Armatimonadota bacterium]